MTADAELWYLNGEPITFSGNFYYPAGAQIPFSPNEMVRSGFFMGVPLYTRTIDEPYSTVYVPLARGFMQPYMRPRAGDIAGSAGTTTLGGIVATIPTTDETVPVFQAAGSPTLIAGAPADDTGQPRGVIPSTPRATAPRPVGTAGTTVAEPRPAAAAAGRPAVPAPTHTRIGPPPEGINAVFVDFRDRRWFSEGRAVPLDRSRMIEIGEIGGFPVFVDSDAPEARIYVATVAGGAMVTPHSRRPPR